MAGVNSDLENDEIGYLISEHTLSGKQDDFLEKNNGNGAAGNNGGSKPKKKRFSLKLRGSGENKNSDNGKVEIQESQADSSSGSGASSKEEKSREKGLSNFFSKGKKDKKNEDDEIPDSDQILEEKEESLREESPDLEGEPLSSVADDDTGNMADTPETVEKLSLTQIHENEEAEEPKKKKRFSLNLKKGKGSGKKKKPLKENKQGKSKDNAGSGIFQQIEKVFNTKPEIIDELFFDLGEISVPVPGTPQKEIDIFYEVLPQFQYVHVKYMGDELLYECLEPPLSEKEQEALRIIRNAFDKMAHSEILLVEEEDRKGALWERFMFIVDIYRFKLTDSQKEKFFYYLHKKYMGFDKIDLLMNDPYIEDVTCNGHGASLYVNHRVYASVRTNVVFEEIELNNFVMRMAEASGRHISVLQPIRDATLPDGSRANLTLGKEVTKRGSTFTIRRFRSNPVSCIDLMNYGTYDSRVLAYFWLMIEYKRSVLAAGGTASGKTTTLNALGSFIPPEYKIVSIEDTAEMNLMHPNWTQSVTRAGFGGSENGKSAGDIELYDLLKAALRQRPEYIIVGEVRGEEAGTLFQAISVGHPCMGTIHAGSIHELLSRVESEPMNVPRNLFASVDMVIFNAMIKVGEHFIRRALRIVEIAELDPDRGDLITNPVFKWDPVTDRYEFSGSSSLFEDIQEEFGIQGEELIREMDERALYIESLAEQGITQYEDVARAIRKYSRQKDELMETTH